MFPHRRGSLSRIYTLEVELPRTWFIIPTRYKACDRKPSSRLAKSARSQQYRGALSPRPGRTTAGLIVYTKVEKTRCSVITIETKDSRERRQAVRRGKQPRESRASEFLREGVSFSHITHARFYDYYCIILLFQFFFFTC